MRTKTDILKDANKLIMEYESIKDGNSTARFCLGKSYDMYWLIKELRQHFENDLDKVRMQQYQDDLDAGLELCAKLKEKYK